MLHKDKIEELKKSVMSTKTFLEGYNSNGLYCKSYLCANLNAKKSKPFTDDEFIKQRMKSMADIMCLYKKADLSKISLSHWTIAKQIEHIGNC